MCASTAGYFVELIPIDTMLDEVAQDAVGVVVVEGVDGVGMGGVDGAGTEPGFAQGHGKLSQ